MNTLTTILLTIFAILNIFLFFTIAWAIKASNNKNARMGGIAVLIVLMVDFLGAYGGVILW